MIVLAFLTGFGCGLGMFFLVFGLRDMLFILKMRRAETHCTKRTMRQTLFVLQGVSGSGKSTLAAQIKGDDPNIVICSTDEYYYKDGKYEFDPSLLAAYHQKNQDRAKQLLDVGKSVIVDNCNIHAWECRPYVVHAVALKIAVVFVRADGCFANSHGVPQEYVDRSRLEMEELTLERVLASRRESHGNDQDLVA